MPMLHRYVPINIFHSFYVPLVYLVRFQLNICTKYRILLNFTLAEVSGPGIRSASFNEISISRFLPCL
jgi:hypothetical protein